MVVYTDGCNILTLYTKLRKLFAARKRFHLLFFPMSFLTSISCLYSVFFCCWFFIGRYYYNVLSGMSTWEKPQSNVEEETIQNDDEEIATVVVLSENDSGSGLLLFPSQEEVMSMVAEFPNWASIFDVEILHAVTEVGSEVNPLHYGETQREEVYSRAWRREDVLILKETAKGVEVVDVEEEEEEEEEITSSVNELRSSYEQYWEEVRHGVDVSMNASSDSGEYIKYVQHQAPMNLEEDKNIREVAAFLREDLQEESNVRGGAGGDPSYHEKMETMMMSMGTMTTSTWTVLSSSYVSLDGSSLSRLIGALRTTSRARVVLLLLLFIFVSPVRDYVHVTSERPVQFQTTTTFVSTVQTRTKQSVSIGSASSSNIGSKDGRMGKEVEKEKEIGHVVDTEIITPIVESTSGAAPATAPKVVAPKIVAPKIVTPKSVTPKSVTPKSFTPKSVTPKSFTPKSVTPELAAQVIPSSMPVAPIAAPVVTAPVVAAPVVAAPVVAAPVVAAPVVAAPVVVAAPPVAAPPTSQPATTTTINVRSRATAIMNAYVKPQLTLLHPEPHDVVSSSHLRCQIRVTGTIEARTRICLQLTGAVTQTFCTEPIKPSAAMTKTGSQESRILPFDLEGLVEGSYTLNTLLIGPRKKLAKTVVHFQVRLN